MGVFSNAAEGAMRAVEFVEEEERKLQFVPCTDDPIRDTENGGEVDDALLLPPMPDLKRQQTSDPYESPTNWLYAGAPSELPYAFAEWAKCQQPVPRDATRVEFTVTDKDLRSTRKVMVSREHKAEDGTVWRIMLKPIVVHENKGGSCFRASRGRAEVQLKCESTLGEAEELKMRFRIAVNGAAREQEDHDFKENRIATLSDSVWDLTNEVQSGAVRIEAHVWKA
jgi:hypothetical protein